MPNSNGCRTAVLYRRVSGEDQKKKGFSLPDQREEQLEYCTRENLKVVREYEDAGYSGKFLERPDLDKLRDLVANGEIDAVIASKRDRLARGIYAGYLKNEFKRRGVELIALDSVTEDTPYGELLENTLDNFSEFERFMIADRMRRGKRSKAKQGKLVACPQSDYGFRYNNARDGYEVNETKMSTVRRIFEMVGVERQTLHAAASRLESEGVSSPRGKRFWSRTGLRKLIMSDVYLAHTYQEVKKIVAPQVATGLDTSRCYGISWYGKQRHTHTREVRIKDGKKIYPRIKKSVDVPREEWIGVPVPDPGIPRGWVLAARESIKDNVKVSNCGLRFWELTGGILRCAICGRAMGTNFIIPRGTGYYRCGRKYRLGIEACSHSKTFRAEETETLVWRFVSEILKDPSRLERGLNEMLERERTLAFRGPGEEEDAWIKKLAELKTQEDRLLDLYLESKLDVDRYETRAAEIKRARKAVEDELERIGSRADRIELLERDREALLNHYTQVVPESLDTLNPEERNRIYKMLDLAVMADQDGSLEVKWALGWDPWRYNEPLLPGSGYTPGR